MDEIVNDFTGTVLALDLASTSGWAVGAPNQKPEFGSLRFAKPGLSRAKYYREFRLWMECAWNVRDRQPDLIVFESPIAPMIMQGRTNINTIKLLIGMCEHLEEWCYGKFELREAKIGEIRAFFLGTNKIKSAQAKSLTIQRCKSLGWQVNNDNEADACALWAYQIACLRPDIAATSGPLFEAAHY